MTQLSHQFDDLLWSLYTQAEAGDTESPNLALILILQLIQWIVVRAIIAELRLFAYIALFARSQ